MHCLSALFSCPPRPSEEQPFLSADLKSLRVEFKWDHPEEERFRARWNRALLSVKGNTLKLQRRPLCHEFSKLTITGCKKCPSPFNWGGTGEPQWWDEKGALGLNPGCDSWSYVHGSGVPVLWTRVSSRFFPARALSYSLLWGLNELMSCLMMLINT